MVTLTLSIQFDLYDAKFISSSLPFGNLLIGSGPFKGKKIADLLVEANKVFGGCPSSYTAAQISDVLTAINENFDDGTKNGGSLSVLIKLLLFQKVVESMIRKFVTLLRLLSLVK